MKCKLEENSRLFDVLIAMKKGYETGDFDSLFPFLAQDCVMESQWVLTPNIGYEVIKEYYTGKGETLAKNQSFPECTIVELIEVHQKKKKVQTILNRNKPEAGVLQLCYTPGKLCLLMKQTLKEKKNSVLVDVTIDNNGKVKRIDL